MNTLQVSVSGIEQMTEFVKCFTLQRSDGRPLPYFSGGSHIVVSMTVNGRVHRNAYSLMGATDCVDSYRIAVRKQDHSRGGSVYLHEQVQVGSELEITYPVNLFAIHKKGRKHLLIAGGIGITPFMSQISDLNRLGYDYELHYASRSPDQAAFRENLQQMCGDRVHFYSRNEGRLDIEALLRLQPLGTHVYVCGPDSMVNTLHLTAAHLGWPDDHVHSEQFSAPPAGAAFIVELRQSNIALEVPGDMSLLEAIEGAGVEAPFMCRGGACGRCEVEVLACDGVIQHHDHYLSDAEKIAGNKIMTCVSRARCRQLILNL
jgi:ferredoxin-NADP reductase